MLGRFLSSAWSKILGAVIAAASTVTAVDIVEAFKDGRAVNIIGAVVGTAILTASRPKTDEEKREAEIRKSESR